MHWESLTVYLVGQTAKIAGESWFPGQPVPEDGLILNKQYCQEMLPGWPGVCGDRGWFGNWSYSVNFSNPYPDDVPGPTEVSRAEGGFLVSCFVLAWPVKMLVWVLPVLL